jgi:hypothetical protein
LEPRNRSLTGLIVCLAHHEGGSTFVTVGDCAETDAAKTKYRGISQRRVVLRFRNGFVFSHAAAQRRSKSRKEELRISNKPLRRCAAA